MTPEVTPAKVTSAPVGAAGFSGSVLMRIGVCAGVYFLDGLVHSILGPLAPEIARTLHLNNADLGPMFSANLIGQCLGLIVFPAFSARLGGRSVIVLSLVGFGLAQSASAFGNSALSLFAWRFAAGVFLGGCLPVCLALVASVAPASRRGLAIMLLFTGYGAGATSAGLVVAAFSDWGGWRAASLAVGLVCITSALPAWFGLRLHSASAERLAIAEVTTSPGPLRIFAPRYLVGTLMLWLLFICMLTISYCLNSWLPTLLVEVGRDRRLAEISVSIFSFGGIISGLVVGILIDRLGALRTLILFLSISTALLLTIGQVLASAPALWLTILLALAGFFVLGAYGGVNVVLALYYPIALRAVGIGWTKCVGRVGTLIAPVVIGIGLQRGVPDGAVMSLFAVPALLAVLSLGVIALAEGRRAPA